LKRRGKSFDGFWARTDRGREFVNICEEGESDSLQSKLGLTEVWKHFAVTSRNRRPPIRDSPGRGGNIGGMTPSEI